MNRQVLTVSSLSVSGFNNAGTKDGVRARLTV